VRDCARGVRGAPKPPNSLVALNSSSSRIPPPPRLATGDGWPLCPPLAIGEWPPNPAPATCTVARALATAASALGSAASCSGYIWSARGRRRQGRPCIARLAAAANPRAARTGPSQTTFHQMAPSAPRPCPCSRSAAHGRRVTIWSGGLSLARCGPPSKSPRVRDGDGSAPAGAKKQNQSSSLTTRSPLGASPGFPKRAPAACRSPPCCPPPCSDESCSDAPMTGDVTGDTIGWLSSALAQRTPA